MRPAMTDISAPAEPTGNIVEFTVSEISQAVKRTLEGAAGPGPVAPAL